MHRFEQLLWATEYATLLPYIYALKLWAAHAEFMEELNNV